MGRKNKRNRWDYNKPSAEDLFNCFSLNGVKPENIVAVGCSPGLEDLAEELRVMYNLEYNPPN